ncbi:DUF4097 family beta strand repeat protein [Candidatus Poribacteria bacterium]|nr:DUF4097 family beta strand repeat protein [Candidatus Poribacteria bacterium]
MDNEVTLIMKMVAAKQISAQMANKILQMLDSFKKEGNPDLGQQLIRQLVKSFDEKQNNNKDVVFTDDLPNEPQIEIIRDLRDGTHLLIEQKSGNIVIQGWEKDYIYAKSEGGVNSLAIKRKENQLKFSGYNDILLYIPDSIAKVTLFSGTGIVDIDSCPGEVAVYSSSGNVEIRKSNEIVKATTSKGNIFIEDCSNSLFLRSKTGDIFTKLQEEDYIYQDIKQNKSDILLADIQTDTGDVSLMGLNIPIKAKSGTGNIQVAKCRNTEMDIQAGNNITLTDVGDDISVKAHEGNIEIEEFSGKLRIESHKSEICLRKTGDAEINIQSDSGDIFIQDCYADLNIKSREGNVSVSGKNLSFGGMGKIRLDIVSGNINLSRRTFEDIKINLENGDVKLDMEKLLTDAEARINVIKGNVTVKMSPDASCQVSTHALPESTKVELPIKIMETDRENISGVMNGGKSTINLNAPNGEIRLLKLLDIN